MNIVLDNIIFSLQRFGGISVVWKELEQRAMADPELRVHILDYPAENVHRAMLHIGAEQEVKMQPRWLERYRSPLYWAKERSIFHSSYFRILHQPEVANITTIHDLTYHYYRSGLARKVHLGQERYALEHSEGIICVSENTRRDLLTHYPKLDEKKVSVIYNGVSASFIQQECSNLTPYETRGYLLYVGNRSAAYKHFGYAVAVAQKVHLPLVIVGNALSEGERKQLEATLGEGNYWVKVSPTQQELVAIYNHAYCLLYPSAYEGFGLPIVEAQRTGCLVIGQAISSIPEVMGKGGVCVPPEKTDKAVVEAMAEQVEAMLSGRTNTDWLREEGKKNSQRFTWDNTYEQVKQVYQHVYTNNK